MNIAAGISKIETNADDVLFLSPRPRLDLLFIYTPRLRMGLNAAGASLLLTTVYRLLATYIPNSDF